MTYRGFKRPDFAANARATDWLDWMEEEDDLLLAVAPPNDRGCMSCLGSVNYRDGGTDTWPTCYNCGHYDGAVDRLVPVTYSVDVGLESMLHRYKDWPNYRWLRLPLTSLLHKFVQFHADCIERQTPYGQIDVAAIVPSDNAARTFNHLDLLLRTVKDQPILARWNWDMDFLTRNRSTSRPARGQLKPSAYNVGPGVVEGASVLLFDDTWTSGSTAASAAAAVKDAGADHVTVLTLGRQLNLSDTIGSTAELYDDSHGEVWDLDVCVICA